MHNLRYYKILFPLIQARFNGNMFGYVIIYILNNHNPMFFHICICVCMCVYLHYYLFIFIIN